MAWLELLKAKDNIRNMENEVQRLLKEHNSLNKKELARHNSMLLDEFDSSMDAIKEELEEFHANMKSHRKYLIAKEKFLRRHYKAL